MSHEMEHKITHFCWFVLRNKMNSLIKRLLLCLLVFSFLLQSSAVCDDSHDATAAVAAAAAAAVASTSRLRHQNRHGSVSVREPEAQVCRVFVRVCVRVCAFVRVFACVRVCVRAYNFWSDFSWERAIVNEIDKLNLQH